MKFRIQNWSLNFCFTNYPPIVIHWSTPLMVSMASGFRFLPGSWLAAIFVVLFHEIGHGVAVRMASCSVTEIQVNGFGGFCKWYGQPTLLNRLKIVWGGILAQVIILFFALLIFNFRKSNFDLFFESFLHTLMFWNFYGIVFNSIPMAPLDGYAGWPLLRRYYRMWQINRKRIRMRNLKMATIKIMARQDQVVPNEISGRKTNLILEKIIKEAVSDKTCGPENHENNKRN